MAGRLETSIWNLTFVAAAGACGPTIPIDDDEADGSFDDSGSGTIGETTTIPPCDDGDCPECRDDGDCNPGEYCTPSGTCEYYTYCGLAGGDDVFRCSPYYYDCYSDFDCAPDERCEYNDCVPDTCDPDVAFGSALLLGSPDEGPVVGLAFVDTDGTAPQELAIATSTQVVLASGTPTDFTPIATGEDFVSLASGDVDADGDLDIVVADRGQGGQLALLTNDAGVFSPLATIASPGALEVVLGDPENDGSADAFVRTDSGIVRHVDLGAPESLVVTSSAAMALVGWSLAYSSEGQSWWLPVATLEPTEPAELIDFEMQSFATARLDDDVDPDVFGVLETEGSTLLFSWRGPVATPAAQATRLGSYPIVAAVDVNGDGIDEPVFIGATEAVVFSPSIAAVDDYDCDSAIGLTHGAVVVAAGDWDGDAGEELAIGSGINLTVLDRIDEGE